MTPAFAGLSSARLFQLNLTIPPGLGTGDLPLRASVGGVQTPAGVVISLQDSATTPQIQSQVLSSTSVAGGGTVTATVTLSSAAPAGGSVIALSSSSNTGSVPPSVTVTAGTTSANFIVSGGAVTSNQMVTITAAYGGGAVPVILTVTPVSAPSFTSLTGVATLVNGTTSNQGQTFSFNALSSPGSTYFDFSGSILQLSSASMTFTLTPTASAGGVTEGTPTGRLAMTGAPLGTC